MHFIIIYECHGFSIILLLFLVLVAAVVSLCLSALRTRCSTQSDRTVEEGTEREEESESGSWSGVCVCVTIVRAI